MYAIETKDLVKKYKDLIAVNELNLKVEKGELFALLGVNGAGKTTTIKMLTGLSKPTSGDALLNGKSIVKNINDVKKIVNVSPQETAVATNLTVLENLFFIAGVYKIENKKEVVENLITKFKLEQVRNKRASK